MAGQVDLSVTLKDGRRSFDSGNLPTARTVPRGQGKKMRSRADIIRRFLEAKNPEDEQNATRLIGMLTNMVRLASGKSPQAVAAFNVLMNRAYGLPRPSDEELESIQKQGGIQLVYIARPAVDESIPVAGVKALPEPKFVEAEIIEED